VLQNFETKHLVVWFYFTQYTDINCAAIIILRKF